MTIISVKFYNFGTSMLWTKNFARNLPKYRGFTVHLDAEMRNIALET